MRNKALLLLLTLPLIACNSVEVNEDLAQGNAEEEVQEAPMAELEEGEARVSISLMFPDEEFGGDLGLGGFSVYGSRAGRRNQWTLYGLEISR